MDNVESIGHHSGRKSHSYATDTILYHEMISERPYPLAVLFTCAHSPIRIPVARRYAVQGSDTRMPPCNTDACAKVILPSAKSIHSTSVIQHKPYYASFIFSASAKKVFKPMSVSGCFNNAMMDTSGQVHTSAPASAQAII